MYKRMNVGTKSLLFGVHQFLWHPWTVGRAWRNLYGRWPTWIEWVCILSHDIGYFGCKTMDGEDGKKHPELGAMIAQRIVKILGGDAYAVYTFTLFHSSHYARMHGAQPSALYLPDKASILFEASWFYKLRARLSGEVYEYIENSPLAKLPPQLKTPCNWYAWYVRKVREKI